MTRSVAEQPQPAVGSTSGGSTRGAVAVVILLGVATLLAAVVLSRVDLLETDGEPTTVLLSGSAVVAPGQVHDTVLVARGDVAVRGQVEGDVVVLDGRARIDGTVGGDVTVLAGTAVLGPEAVVGGDVATSAAPRIDPDAAVGGDLRTVGARDLPSLVPGSWWAVLLVGLGLAVLVLLVAARRRVTDLATVGRARPGRSLAMGVVALVLAPVVLVVLSASLVGTVLAVVLGSAVVLLLAVGAATAATMVGRLLLAGDGLGPPLLGWTGCGLVLGLSALIAPPVTVLLAAGLVVVGSGAVLVGLLERPETAPVPATPVAGVPDWWPEDPVPEAPSDDHPAADGPKVLAALPILDPDP